MALTKNDIQNVRNAYYKLSKLDQAITKAEACEYDCDELKRRQADAMRRLQKVNEVMGGDYPENV
jgi:hypothetical protein